MERTTTLNPRYNILYVTPEAVPFAKTGGLADVAGALPPALAKMGQNVKVVMPRYKQADERKFGLQVLRRGMITAFCGRDMTYDLKSFRDDTAGIEFLFIDYPGYFHRDSLYVDPETGRDWKDNDERFIFFARTVLESIIAIGFKPDIVHANDWQSAPVMAYLKTAYADDPFFDSTGAVFSIHNIAYQGNFPAEIYNKFELDRKYYYPMSPFEYWGKVSFLKAGICFADKINTVSETYAREIQQSNEYGYGMEGILRERSSDLWGILNGVDYDIWNPSTDSLIPFNYSADNLEGKRKNKMALIELAGLPFPEGDVPLIGIISRLADQKGFDLIAEIGEKLMELDLQIVLLGTGEKKYHDLFGALNAKYPDKISANLTFDNKLAHLIEAGADMFLMPSRYEPCGLNQIYSLKYGTVPIVRKTGGLADTVRDCSENRNNGNGFVFAGYDSERLYAAVVRAVNIYHDQRAWRKLMLKGMSEDYGWEKSARRYMRMYTEAIGEHG
jgi:starch synthase